MPGFLLGKNVPIFGHPFSATKKTAMELSRSIGRYFIGIVVLLVCGGEAGAQPGATLLKWSKDGNSYYEVKSGGIVRVSIPDDRETVVVSQEMLRPEGRKA